MDKPQIIHIFDSDTGSHQLKEHHFSRKIHCVWTTVEYISILGIDQITFVDGNNKIRVNLVWKWI